MFVPMHEIIPEGRSGEHVIEHFEISQEESTFSDLRAAINHRPGEYVSAGKYCRLRHNGGIVMTDTDMEKGSNVQVLHKAHGDVLIAGLGLGMILVPILKKPGVTSVTVVEKYREVIGLVEPHIREEANEKPLTVFCADIFDWLIPKGKKWDVVYFDIWAHICQDNLKDVAKLKRKFARRLNRASQTAWMGAWMESQLRRDRRRGI